MSAQPVIVLGAGGNCRDVVDAMLDVNAHSGEPVFTPLGYLDDDPAKWGQLLGGVPVLGPLAAVDDWPDAQFIDGLNGVGLTAAKAGILQTLDLPRERYATVVHPSAQLSTMAELGAGSVLLHNVTVNSNATIGDHVLVLPGSVVSHDDIIDNFCYLAPGVVLAGYVHLEGSVYVGARAAISHRLTIGEAAVIGIGSVVLHNVEPGVTVAGAPARPLR